MEMVRIRILHDGVPVVLPDGRYAPYAKWGAGEEVAVRWNSAHQALVNDGSIEIVHETAANPPAAVLPTARVSRKPSTSPVETH